MEILLSVLLLGPGVCQDDSQALGTVSTETETERPNNRLQWTRSCHKGLGHAPAWHTGGPFKTAWGGEESCSTKSARRLRQGGNSCKPFMEPMLAMIIILKQYRDQLSVSKCDVKKNMTVYFSVFVGISKDCWRFFFFLKTGCLFPYAELVTCPGCNLLCQ